MVHHRWPCIVAVAHLEDSTSDGKKEVNSFSPVLDIKTWYCNVPGQFRTISVPSSTIGTWTRPVNLMSFCKPKFMHLVTAGSIE